MPIIRNSRLYVCYYRLWCAMPWLLVVGGQVQTVGYAFVMRDVARLQSSNIPHPERIADCPAPDLQQQATKHCTPQVAVTHTYSLELLMMGIEVPETC